MARLESRNSNSGKGNYAQQAVFYLRAKILRGELRGGDPLEECLLGTHLHLSQSQLQKVFEQLISEGILQVSPDGKYKLIEFNDRDIYDAIELQSVLEGAAARLAAMRIEDSNELKRMRRFHTRMLAMIKRHQSSPRFWTKPSEDLTLYSQLNAGFHRCLIELSKSRMIASAVDRIHSLPFSSPAAITIPVGAEDIPAIAMQQHAGILDALERHQPELAERLARQHALAVLRNVELDLEGRRPNKSNGLA